MNLTDSRITDIISDCGGNFSPSEFGKDREHLYPLVIQELVSWRNWHGMKVQITSAYRETGSHTTGKAIDVLLWNKWQQSQPKPMQIWRLATTWPFLGVGIYFDWNDGIGLHLDVIRSERDRPLRWIRNGDYYYQSVINGKFYSDNDETTLQEQTKRWQSQ